jgi:hypothetical protein
MANHPRTYKTSKELILPREIRYTTSKERACPMICKLFLRLLISVALKFINTKQELDTPSKEIGVIEKKRPKLKHLLGLEHRNIPIQLDLWGNEAIFRRKGQTTQYGYPRYET